MGDIPWGSSAAQSEPGQWAYIVSSCFIQQTSTECESLDQGLEIGWMTKTDIIPVLEKLVVQWGTHMLTRSLKRYASPVHGQGQKGKLPGAVKSCTVMGSCPLGGWSQEHEEERDISGQGGVRALRQEEIWYYILNGQKAGLPGAQDGGILMGGKFLCFSLRQAGVYGQVVRYVSPACWAPDSYAHIVVINMGRSPVRHGLHLAGGDMWRALYGMMEICVEPGILSRNCLWISP